MCLQVTVIIVMNRFARVILREDISSQHNITDLTGGQGMSCTSDCVVRYVMYIRLCKVRDVMYIRLCKVRDISL